MASWSRPTCRSWRRACGIEQGSDERPGRDLELGHRSSRGVAILAMSLHGRDASRRGSGPRASPSRCGFEAICRRPHWLSRFSPITTGQAPGVSTFFAGRAAGRLGGVARLAGRTVALPKARKSFVRLAAPFQSLHLAYRTGPRPRPRLPSACSSPISSQPSLTGPGLPLAPDSRHAA